MKTTSDSYDAAAALVRNRVHVRVIDYVRKNAGAHVADILGGTGIPPGTLGRVLRALVALDTLTVDVPSEKRSSASVFRYSVNEHRIRELLATLEAALTPEDAADRRGEAHSDAS